MRGRGIFRGGLGASPASLAARGVVYGVVSWTVWGQVASARSAERVQGAPKAREQAAAGALLLKERRYGEAMDQFEAALAAAPEDEQARKGEVSAATAWAREEDQEHHPEQGMEVLERAIKQLPREPELLLTFGIGAMTLGQLPIAAQALHAADTLRPHHPETMYALARVEIEEQQLPDAERDLKAYLTVRPQDASAYFGLGHVYAMEQRAEEARQAFQRSVELQPLQTESYYQLGQLDLEADREDSAKAQFAKVLARDPTHAGALTGMGQLALRAKQYETAEHLLAQAEQSDPGYAPPHYFRGLALAKLGRKEEAAKELQRGDSRPHATMPSDASPPSNQGEPRSPNSPGGA